MSQTQRKFLEGNSLWDFRIDVFKVFILLIDMTGACIDLFLKSFRNFRSTEGEAIGTLTTFVIFGIIGIFIMVIISAILSMKLTKNNLTYFIVSDIVVIVAALLYYIGDNLHPILETYGSDLSCDMSCVENVQAAGRSVTFTALILFRGFPMILKKWLQVNHISVVEIEASKTPALFSAAFIFHILSLLVDYDATYSSVWGNSFSPINSSCTSSDLRGSWASWAISFLLGVAFILLYFYLEYAQFSKTFCSHCKPSSIMCLMLVTLAIMCILPGAYLLGDNDEPIGCVCNGFNTTNINDCSEFTGYKIRFGIIGGTIALTATAVTVALLFLFQHHVTNNER